MIGKLCTGAFSAATQQSLASNQGRAQWQTYRCEKCHVQVGARLEKGKWVPEEHWLSVSYEPRRPKAAPQHTSGKTVASYLY